MFTGIVLAGGVGVRMKSSVPKLFHKLLGKPIIKYVLDNVSRLNLTKIIVVIPPDLEENFRKIGGEDFSYVIQENPRGTGDAVRIAFSEVEDSENVLIVNGDAPLISSKILEGMINFHLENKPSATLLTTVLPDPMAYGRIVRDSSGKVLRIVEAKDASLGERDIQEVNTGAYCFSVDDLSLTFPRLSNENVQKEYYLTQVVEILNDMRKTVMAYPTDLGSLALGINSRKDLAEATRSLLNRKIEDLMDEGVTIVLPESTYIEPDVKIKGDTIIEPYCMLKGNTIIGSNCHIGPSTYLDNASIGDKCEVFYSVIKDSTIEECVKVGPYAQIKNGTVIKKDSAIGDFVEVKNSIIGSHTKAMHHSYLGDAEIGERVNIGAGVITCNYDGKKKHRTIIEDDAFIGSNTNLIAPIRIGKGAATGAGAVVTRDVESNTVVVGVPARFLKKREEGGGSG
ncbi:MAG: bifunctional UDP-N-acetylglucosamine diphosphorylase/glucosamine-1-phosphate N-acetyltransferase GlmU [bacterium]